MSVGQIVDPSAVRCVVETRTGIASLGDQGEEVIERALNVDFKLGVDGLYACI